MYASVHTVKCTSQGIRIHVLQRLLLLMLKMFKVLTSSSLLKYMLSVSLEGLLTVKLIIADILCGFIDGCNPLQMELESKIPSGQVLASCGPPTT